jgi:hypothetical protein
MLFNVLVRNYFERNGSFDGIEETTLGEKISENCKLTGESKEELLFRLLGYDDAESSVSLVELRRLLSTGRDASEYLDSIEAKEAGKRLKVARVPMGKHKKKFSEMGDLVAAYYREDPSNLVEEENRRLPFGAWLEQNSRLSPAKIMNSPCAKHCLVKFGVKDVEPMVYNGVLYTREELSAEEQRSVQELAIQLATNSGSVMRQVSRLSFADKAVLFDANKALYLKVLDYAMIKGVSYAEIMAQFGVQIPDLIKAYELTGYAFYYLEEIDGAQVMYYKTKSNCWRIEPEHLFVQMIESNLGAQQKLDCVPKPEEAKLKFVKTVSGGTDELRCF